MKNLIVVGLLAATHSVMASPYGTEADKSAGAECLALETRLAQVDCFHELETRNAERDETRRQAERAAKWEQERVERLEREAEAAEAEARRERDRLELAEIEADIARKDAEEHALIKAHSERRAMIAERRWQRDLADLQAMCAAAPRSHLLRLIETSDFETANAANDFLYQCEKAR